MDKNHVQKVQMEQACCKFSVLFWPLSHEIQLYCPLGMKKDFVYIPYLIPLPYERS
jgi:hypothetical protein